MSMITDVDVVKVEAEAYSAAAFEGQKRCGGTNGIVAGTQFTAAGVDFNACRISAGCVIHLASADGVINGEFEVVSVLDAGHLSVSQLRTSTTDPAIPVGSASGLTWSIKTLGPQITQAEVELSARLGLKPGKPDAVYDINEVQNTDAVKQILTALLLARVYTAVYTSSSEADIQAGYEKKRMWYAQQAEKLLAAVSIPLPTVS